MTKKLIEELQRIGLSLNINKKPNLMSNPADDDCILLKLYGNRKRVLCQYNERHRFSSIAETTSLYFSLRSNKVPQT